MMQKQKNIFIKFSIGFVLIVIGLSIFVGEIKTRADSSRVGGNSFLARADSENGEQKEDKEKGEIKCPSDTGRIPNADKTDCVCPAGLEGVKDKDNKEITNGKCVLQNPAPGILVGTRTFEVLLKDIINIALYFAGGIAVLFLIIGGFRYVTSLGNEEAMEKAKKTITSAVLGIIIIVMAFALVAIINTLLTKGTEGQAPNTTGMGTTGAGGNAGTAGQGNAGSQVAVTSPPTANTLFYTVGGGGNPIYFFASNCPEADCAWTFSSLPSWLHQVPSNGGNSLQGAADLASEAGQRYEFTA